VTKTLASYQANKCFNFFQENFQLYTLLLSMHLLMLLLSLSRVCWCGYETYRFCQTSRKPAVGISEGFQVWQMWSRMQPESSQA